MDATWRWQQILNRSPTVSSCCAMNIWSRSPRQSQQSRADRAPLLAIAAGSDRPGARSRGPRPLPSAEQYPAFQVSKPVTCADNRLRLSEMNQLRNQERAATGQRGQQSGHKDRDQEFDDHSRVSHSRRKHQPRSFLVLVVLVCCCCAFVRRPHRPVRQMQLQVNARR